jgi:DNA-binding GntR family transcriptional regulator
MVHNIGRMVYHAAMTSDHDDSQAAAATAPATGAARVAAALRAEITSGALKPGSRVRQREVAERLGVSTTPVREALATLEREGLIRVESHKGATVFGPSEAELRDHYEIRIALEVLAVRRAATFCGPDDAARLQALLERMRTADDPVVYVELNQRFHSELYELGGNRQLADLIASLRDRDSAYLHLYAARHVPNPRLDREHRAILGACALGDADAAEEALRAHLGATVDHVSRLLRERERAG